MERVFDYLLNHKRQSSFNVSEFLAEYNSLDNPLRHERLFTKQNTKDLIEKFIKYKMSNRKVEYILRERRWFFD